MATTHQLSGADRIANNERRREAATLLRQHANLIGDPGEQGYSKGMAERIEGRPWETVTPEYVDNMRHAVAEAQSAIAERWEVAA